MEERVSNRCPERDGGGDRREPDPFSHPIRLPFDPRRRAPDRSETVPLNPNGGCDVSRRFDVDRFDASFSRGANGLPTKDLPGAFPSKREGWDAGGTGCEGARCCIVRRSLRARTTRWRRSSIPSTDETLRERLPIPRARERLEGMSDAMRTIILGARHVEPDVSIRVRARATFDVSGSCTRTCACVRTGCFVLPCRLPRITRLGSLVEGDSIPGWTIDLEDGKGIV